MASNIIKHIYLMLMICGLSLTVTGCEYDKEQTEISKLLHKEIIQLRKKNKYIAVSNPEATALYSEVMDLVSENYIIDVDQKEIFNTTLAGMQSAIIKEELNDNQLVEMSLKHAIESLDKYSTYYDKNSFRELSETVSGEFGGLGVEVKLHPLGLEVVRTIENTPASRANIAAGDLIFFADNRKLAGMEMQDIISILRGAIHSDIHLNILKYKPNRPPINKTNFTTYQHLAIAKKLRREIIQVASVNVNYFAKDQIGYIHLSHFNDHSGDELVKAMQKMTQTYPALRAWIVDVRDNPGGVFSQALSVSDAFLQNGEIAFTQSRNQRQSYHADSTDYSKGKQMMVLVNHGSASAAEIFAGAVKDLNRGVLIGEPTYGKGLVQTLFPLSNGGGLKITTSEYHTASGHPVGIGVSPDIRITDDPRTESDEVLEGARQYFLLSLQDTNQTSPSEISLEIPINPFGSSITAQ